MRILFLDSKLEFLNPTRELLLPLLESIADVTPFGPGYVSEALLTAGVDAFIDSHGTFDALVVTEHITNAAVWPSRSNVEAFYRRSHRRRFPTSQLRFVPEILEYVLKSNLPKIALAMETDYYGLGKIEISTLLRFDGIVGFGEQFVRPTRDLPRYQSEAFSRFANDNYANMVRTHADKIVSFPPFISSYELAVRPSGGQKRPRVAVPGSSYSARKSARENLSTAGLLAPSARHLRKAFGAMSKVGIPTYSSSAGQAVLRGVYRWEIRHSPVAFTDGSGLEWPVRKFFEIPALGTALMCLPCSGFYDLGFVDGESAIISSPETIVDDARRLLAEPEALSRLQRAGWDVVSKGHTVKARAPVLEQALNRLVQGTFSGSWWDKGTLVLS